MPDAYVNKIIRAVNRLIDDIKGRHFDVEALILFGSLVRGDLTPTSDVDLCVVLKDGESHENDGVVHIAEINRYMCEMLGDVCEVDYVYCHKSDLLKRDRVFDSITREGRVLWQPI